MDGKYAEPLPCWDKDGIFDVSGGEFQSGKERLAALCAMADALSGLRAGGPTLEELARDVLAGRIPDAKTQAAILRVYCMERGFDPK